MDVTLKIPDAIAAHLAEGGQNLTQRALEGFALEELRAGRIGEPELGEMLGLERIEIDGFLKSHGVFHNYTMEDFELEREALKSLGL